MALELFGTNSQRWLKRLTLTRGKGGLTLSQRFKMHGYHACKEVYQQLILRTQESRLLFIIGCQRSGTTMMSRIFDKDWRTKVYGEVSVLSLKDKPERLRLNPISSLKSQFESDQASLIVVKPLVETQNIRGLLHDFPEARSLWIYRHYKDVTNSNLKKFTMRRGIKDLAAIVQPKPGDWRHEHVSQKTRALVKRFFSEDMNPYDAAALFWYVRNQFFFDLELARHSRIMMCKYEEFVAQPIKRMEEIYHFAGVAMPNEKITKQANNRSVGKGREIKLSPDIEGICEQMLAALDKSYQDRYAIDY